MGQISSGIGLVSGINSKDIIDQLISLESRPKTLIQGRKDKLDAQKKAYGEILAKLSSLQSVGRTFERPSTFAASTAKSADEDVLTATAGVGATVGSYQFQVARLVTAQQSVSTTGFTDPNALVGAGKVTVEMGGGNLNAPTNLSQLNAGAGVRRGQFRITDRGGMTSVIDTTAAVTVDDVVKKINNALETSVRASVDGDRIVLTDLTGRTTNNLMVADLGDGMAAADLGLVASVAATTMTGADVNSAGTATALSLLNDGRGVRAAATGADFRVTARNGANVDISLAGAKTLGDVIARINAAGTTRFRASVAAGGNGLTITDTTGSGGTFRVAALNGSKAAADLGIAKTGVGATIAGNQVLASLNTVLISSLKGGVGVPMGRISIRDRSRATQQVDLSAAKTVQEVLTAITTKAGLRVTASLNASGNGIQIADRSGGTGDLVIAEVDSTTAAALGINGTFDASKPIVRGANLQMQWINENTQLSTFNGGKGVTPGVFTITSSRGAAVDIDLSAGTFTTLGQVMTEINARAAGITASINANGDGLLINDAAGGAGKMKIENKTGTAATDLNIAGTAVATTIDGSWERTVDLTPADTITTAAEKLKTLAFGVSAAIINDGSATNPYRLSLTAFNAGRAGRVVFDGGGTALDARTLVESQDAAVFVGGADSAAPLLVTSSKNQLANVIPGVTLDLHGVSSKPVALNVTRDPDSVVEEMKKFAEGFNTVVTVIKELTKYDTEKKVGGLLLGESAVQQVQSQMYAALNGVVKGAGRYRILADVGMKVGEGAKVEFNEDKFREAFAADPEAVKNLFSQAAAALNNATPLAKLNDGSGVRRHGTLPDMRFRTRSGTRFDLTVPRDGTVGDLIAAMNTAGAGRVTAAVNDKFTGLVLTDTTTGAGAFSGSAINGSAASIDLGIGGSSVAGVLAGTPIFKNTTEATTGGGVGYLIERSMKLLVDPVDGVITRQNKTIDERNLQFQARMDNLDKLVEAKRARLERQFATMESVLAGLQSQQGAISSLAAG